MEEFNTDFLLVIQSICPGRCSGRVSLVDDVVEIVLVVVFDFEKRAVVDDLDALVLVLGISVQLLHKKSSPFVLNESFAR